MNERWVMPGYLSFMPARMFLSPAVPGAAILRPFACIRSDSTRSVTTMQGTHRRRRRLVAGARSMCPTDLRH